jgi:hypothetical protein
MNFLKNIFRLIITLTLPTIIKLGNNYSSNNIEQENIITNEESTELGVDNSGYIENNSEESTNNPNHSNHQQDNENTQSDNY